VPTGLAAALGAEPTAVLTARDYLAVYETVEDIEALTPDFAAIAALDLFAVIVTAPGRGDVDFVSRFFAPAKGVDEDPVTGSAHCFLAPFWAERLGRPDLVGYQASARGGVVRTRVVGDRVKLGGRAITILRGELLH
jgi:predicted PhzF superfamily epimerase YddE/YHI9